MANAEVSTLSEGSCIIKTRSALLTSFLFMLTIITLAGCDAGVEHHTSKLSGATMGTSYHIKVVGNEPLVAQDTLQKMIDERLLLINQQMSTYIDDSELSLLNRNNSREWVALSEPLFEVIAISDTISRLSDGAFDITIGPLIELWGFGVREQGSSVPSAAERRIAQSNIGFKSIKLDAETGSILREKPVRIDLSAVAKGYGVDVVAALLEEQGYVNYMVEIGGEIRVSGHNGTGNLWRIGIEKPTPGLAQTSRQAIAMTNVAMATSGDYRNYYEVDGVRYSHTIDPRTASPITHNLVSVTVLAQTSAEADALATAFNVMGVDAALPLANREGIAAFFIIKDGNEFRDIASLVFEPYLLKQK